MNRGSISIGLSVNLSDWINRCYSVYSSDGNIGHFMNGFVENVCSFRGIFGAWIFKQAKLKPGYELISSFSKVRIDTENLLLASFRKDFKLIEKPWIVINRRFDKSHLFAQIPHTQPEDALRVFIVPGFNFEGEINLVILAENGLAEIISGIMPRMFQNILEFSKLKYGNDDLAYRLLLENQNELVVKVDDKGRFLFVSPTYCKLFGMTAQELIGSNFVPLVHPDDIEPTFEAMKQLEVYPNNCFIQQRAKTALGWRWIAWSDKAILDYNGKISAIIGVGRDITEQKQIEQELLESENKFQTAFRSSPNLMSISRMSDGLIYDVNDKFASFLQLSRNEIIGKRTPEFGLYRTISRSVLESILIQDGRIESFEITLISQPNEIIEGLFSAEIVELKGEKCLVSSFQDITELRKAQAEVEDYQIHLEGLVEQRTARIQEINDELGRFTNSVCHDLKAPLRAMHGFADALKEDHSQNLDTEGIIYLQRICNASDQMETLINDLLQYSKLSSLELTLLPTDTNEAIHVVLISLSEVIRKKNAIVKVKKGLPDVLAFMPVLVRVFTNLITNSLNFVEAGAIPVITISGSTREDKALIMIKDNGIGIPKEKHKVIFEVFERLHGIESYPGNGIGLSIVKKAMERMGGKVSVTSSPGKGSTFELELRSAQSI
jgi:PAS domain S-box-containing protein